MGDAASAAIGAGGALAVRPAAERRGQRHRRTAPLSYLIKPPRCCTELEQLCRRHEVVMCNTSRV